MILKSLFLRPVRRRPLRFLVTVVGVAVGVASVISTLLASRAAIASFREGVAEIAGETKLEVSRVGGVDEDVLGLLRPLARDAVIVPVIEEIALQPELGDTVRVLGVDLLVDQNVREVEVDLQAALPSDAAMDRMLGGDGVLVPAALAKRCQLTVNGTLRLTVRSRPMSLTVAGIFKPHRFASAWDRLVVVDIATAQELFNRVGRVDRIELSPRSGVDTGSLAKALREKLGADYQIRQPSERGEQTSRMVRSLQFNLTALSGISLLVGAVLVATTLATSVVQRRSILALLRSLGAPRGRIAAAVLAEAASIGVLGGWMGVMLGFLGARGALSSVRSTVAAMVQGIPASEIRWDPWLAAGGVVMGLLVSLAASILPLWEALTTPPLQGLRSECPSILPPAARRRAMMLIVLLGIAAVGLSQLPAMGGLPFAAVLAALAVKSALMVAASPMVDGLSRLGAHRIFRVVGTPLRLAAAGLAAGRRRASWAAGAVSMTVALAVAIATMVDSFRFTVIDWTEQSMRSDIWVRPLAASTGVAVGDLDQEIVQIAERLFGREALDPFYCTPVLLEGESIALGGAAFDVVRRHGGVPFLDGRDSRDVFAEVLNRHVAVINEPLSRRFGIRRGDTIRMQGPSGSIEREVVGVYYEYSNSQGMAVIDVADFLRLFPGEDPQSLAIFVPEGIDPATGREEFMRALGGRWRVEALLNYELRREVIDVFNRTFAITTALQLMSSVVAVIAVLTVLFTLVSERRQDLGVLRALGGSRLQVVGVVVGQAGLLGITGAVGGLVGGLLVGIILVKVINVQSFGWTLRFLPPWGMIATIVCWVVPACLLAGLAPAWAAATMTPQEVLREEG